MDFESWLTGVMVAIFLIGMGFALGRCDRVPVPVPATATNGGR